MNRFLLNLRRLSKGPSSFGLLFFCTIFCQTLLATPELEEDLFVPAVDVRPKTLTLNPASTKSSTAGLDMIGGRKSRKTVLSQENNLSSTTANSQKDFIGLAGQSPLPDGLSLGGYHYRSFKKNELSSTDRSNKPVEAFSEYHTGARVTLDLTNNMRLGVSLRHIQIHNSILGSFNADSTTNIKGSMTGLGSGLAFDLEKAHISLVYYQPMQGKTEILHEEKRLVKPGLVQASGNLYAHKQFSLGLAITRYFYRRDDLAQETTADDAQQTSIDLRGLDPDRFIFPYQKISLGFSLALNDSIQTLLGITQNYVQAITSPTALPDANNDTNPSYRYYQIKLGLAMHKKNLYLELIAFQLKYSRSIDISPIDGTISQNERGLLLDLSYGL